MIQAKRIRVEYLKGSGEFPTVIDIGKPQVTWNVEGAKIQRAFQVKAVGNKDTCFDSGKVESREMKCVLDADFQSRELVQVEIRLWGEEDEETAAEENMSAPKKEQSSEINTMTEFSCETSCFEMGLLTRNDWKAKWINPEVETPDPEKERPASYLKKEFVLKEVPEKARLYAAAHGIYQVFVNGKEVKGFVLAPGTSEYVQRLQYQTYDVTSLLQKGTNTITAIVGNGWWRGTTTYDGVKNGWGEDVAFLAQLEADDAVVCATDETWQATQEGSVREADLMMGEVYDAGREKVISGFIPCGKGNSPGSSDAVGVYFSEADNETDAYWHNVKPADFGYDNLVCSNCPPVLEHESFVPKAVTSPKGETILDFGQNIAGYIEFDMECNAGEIWKFTHGETLDAEGNFCNSNFQSTNFYCAQEIIYKAKAGWNHFKAFGTFMGFRYVKVEMLDNMASLGSSGQYHCKKDEPGVHEKNGKDGCAKNEAAYKMIANRIMSANFKAHAVYSDLEILTDFQCGHPLVNQLYQNALWSIKGNLIDIPTDCPTREKSGFTGDLVTYIHTFQYLMEAYPMVRKFIENQAASQDENGCVKQIVADCRPMGAIDGAAGWSDSFEILPWKLGQRYNDYRVFADNYANIQKWMKFCVDRAASETKPENQDNPLKAYFYDSGFHWGEWAEPGVDCMEELMYSGAHGNPEVATAYMAQGCAIMAEESERLKRVNMADLQAVQTQEHKLNKTTSFQGVELSAHGAGTSERIQDSVNYKEVSEKAKKAYETAFIKEGIPVSAGYEKWKSAGGSAQWGNNTDVFSAVLHEPEYMPETEEPSKRMCRYIRPVALNLVDESTKQKLADQLNYLVEKSGYCLNTGFLTTHELCRTLSDNGYTETAYKLLLNEKCPGWLYSVKCGATTVPENWDAYGKDGSRNASFNHYSYGSVVGWLLDTAAGIRLKDGKITIAPKTCKELGFVSCSYQSPFGEIRSSWKYEKTEENTVTEVQNNGQHIESNVLKNGQKKCVVSWQFQIPDNCEAEIYLENGEKHLVGPGVYSFEYCR